MRKHLYSFQSTHDALRLMVARTGLSGSEDIRRALRLWLERQGVHIAEDEQQHRQVKT